MTEEDDQSRFAIWKTKLGHPRRFGSDLDRGADLFGLGRLPRLELLPEPGVAGIALCRSSLGHFSCCDYVYGLLSDLGGVIRG